ncbi:hypothetical protein EB796_012214 [Bugula neritina]|uniref:Uncharacterized protein n=1 Tax=Bugula neritina TaxID=10212 RepID=A0A7J7JU98_BUGNE|nr:hypothetical protein EB796_012214 [Bugula neritina]
MAELSILKEQLAESKSAQETLVQSHNAELSSLDKKHNERLVEVQDKANAKLKEWEDKVKGRMSQLKIQNIEKSKTIENLTSH